MIALGLLAFFLLLWLWLMSAILVGNLISYRLVRHRQRWQLAEEEEPEEEATQRIESWRNPYGK